MQWVEIVMMAAIGVLTLVVTYMGFLLQKQNTEEEKLKRDIIYYFSELIKPFERRIESLDDEVHKLSIQATSLRGKVENNDELIIILRGDIVEMQAYVKDIVIPQIRIR